jgi:1-acyl-sn-glycerol-3-phosphate acyltransferase
VILVGNHPNGLVDPIVLALACGRPVRFLGKAPLFDMPVIGTLMRGLQALPVHRPQDAADTSRNEETFAAVHGALADGDLVCLFPEGKSHNEPALQTLKTGAARMALGAETRAGFGLGVRVVPVGLVYRAKRRFRSRVATWIGAPIEVADLRDEYARDEREAVRILTARIAAQLSEVTLELDRWEDLPLIELAERIERSRARADERDVLERLRAFALGARVLRAREPERVDALAARIESFRSRLAYVGATVDDLEIRYRPSLVVRYAARNLLHFLVSLPFVALGTAFWFVPYRVTGLVARLMRPERDLFATVTLLGALLFFPLWYTLATVLAWLFAGALWGVVVLLVTPLAGLFTLHFRDWGAETLADVRTFLRLGRRDRLRAHLRADRDELAAEIESLRARLADGAAEPAP